MKGMKSVTHATPSLEPGHEKRVLSSSDAEIEISIALER